MKPETKLGKQLQTFNRSAGLTHLVQAVVLFSILNDETKIPVITRFFTETPDGIRPVSETLFEFPIAFIGPIFLLLSAIAHLLISAPFYIRRYERNIENGTNPPRWWEYSISSSLMLVVLLMLGGLIELSTIVFIFTLNFIMNLMGLMMEKYNQLTEKTSWLPFNIGVIAGIVPWIMGGLYFWVSTNNIADSIPIYAQFAFLLTFLFFNSFAINMWLQYKKIGKWKDYAYGEKAYIVLSLVSKSALGWIIVLGTMGI
ncbi:MAG: heliorhodopsin HeR [Ilumatobacteraceae bacterium]|nr:heliorhodopsin HeR [Ilumatobacteraceae bacterium]